MNGENLSFNRGQKRREELQLPILHFIATDDWMDKLGHDAFCAWLKFYSWCDRSDERDNKVYDVIPTSFTKIMNRLGVGRKKFYNSIIRPLWNYGLIDIVEYQKSENEGQKPMNIIVYEYPQNEVTKKHQPLDKIRDYDTQYKSNARTFAQKGGRSKKEINHSEGVSSRNRGGFPHETGGGFTQKPNNDSNNITNDSNNITNDSNLNLSPMENDKKNIEDTIWNLELPMALKQKIKAKVRANELHFTVSQLFDIENAYHYQIDKGLVFPEGDSDDDVLNDYDFTQTVMALMEKINTSKINSMKAMIDKWVENGFSYKFDRNRQIIK